MVKLIEIWLSEMFILTCLNTNIIIGFFWNRRAHDNSSLDASVKIRSWIAITLSWNKKRALYLEMFKSCIIFFTLVSKSFHYRFNFYSGDHGQKGNHETLRWFNEGYCVDVWPKMVTLHTAEEGGTKVIKKNIKAWIVIFLNIQLFWIYSWIERGKREWAR